MDATTLLAITPYPALSALMWIALGIAVMYLARSSAHKVIVTTCQALHDLLEIVAQALGRTDQHLKERTREVLLAAGREAKERIIEREFDRVAGSVQKDLAGYPALQRTLSEAIARIDEDHQNAVDAPPDPPGWVKAVEAVAKMDARKDSLVGDILGDIHASLVKAQARALEEYRKVSRGRHALLKRMMPHWRRIQRTLTRVDKNVESVLERSRSIDRHIQEYEEIVRGTDRAQLLLSSSSLVQFFVSATVLTVAVGGAAINFSLISRPMAEMVGGTSVLAGFRTANIAALVIIMVEISMGLFLMESLRITRLFPVIGALPDKVRVRMIGVTFSILFLLASVEAGLAYMREILMQDELATSALLRGGEPVAQNDYLWITTVAQMGMGFTLPFALVFVAIPLETFVHSLRTVLGVSIGGMLRLLALSTRLLGELVLHAGAALVRVYDIPIFMPLWIEAKYYAHRRPPSGSDKSYAEVS